MLNANAAFLPVLLLCAGILSCKGFQARKFSGRLEVYRPVAVIIYENGATLASYPRLILITLY